MLNNEEENTVSSLILPIDKERAAALIADGVTQRKTAEIVEKSTQTINAWCKEEEFQQRVEELKVNIARQVAEILNGGAKRAAHTVVKMADGSIKFSDARELNPRIRAALYILDRFKAPSLSKTTIPGKRSEKSATTEAELTEDSEALELLDR